MILPNQEVSITQGWANFSYEGPHWKNFEAEGRTDWKSKIKKVITTADVLFSSQNLVKKGHHVRKCPIFYSISVTTRSNVNIL